MQHHPVLSRFVEQRITADEWSGRYDDGTTPWDLGQPHPELLARLDVGLQPFGANRALVPGSGRGYDALALGQAGWSVTALDVAVSIAAELATRMESIGGDAVIGDAFAFEAEPFDLVFDHTFFCAIDPAERAEFGAFVNRITDVDSRFASVVFPIGRPHSEPGPPWGVDVGALTAALGDRWELVVDESAVNPPQRRWVARWGEWVRRR